MFRNEIEMQTTAEAIESLHHFNLTYERTQLLLEDRSNEFLGGYKMKDGEMYSIPMPVPYMDSSDELKAYEMRVSRVIENSGASMGDRLPSCSRKATNWKPNLKAVKERVESSRKKRQNLVSLSPSNLPHPNSDIGIIACHNSACISNDIDEFKVWDLINEDGKLKYPNLSDMLTKAFQMLKDRNMFINKTEVISRVKVVQKRLFAVWTMKIASYAMLKEVGIIGYAKEIASDEQPLGSAELCCPYCGSMEIQLAWKEHANRSEWEQDEMVGDWADEVGIDREALLGLLSLEPLPSMDPYTEESEREYDEECEEYFIDILED